MLVPPVVAAMSRPCSMRAGATTLLNAQKGPTDVGGESPEQRDDQRHLGGQSTR